MIYYSFINTHNNLLENKNVYEHNTEHQTREIQKI